MSDTNCGCGGSDSSSSNSDLQKKTFEAQMYPSYKSNQSGLGCDSNKGKFYDLTTEAFTFPKVGMESYLRVCDGTLWKVGQFIGISTGPSSIAAVRITEVGSQRLKVLNGCDRSGENGIFGNPDPGTIIPIKSLIYPIPPSGCESGFATKIIQTLEQFGVQTVINILAESENICFTSLADLSENEEGHLFVGTMPDCDCAPDSLFSSCFKKIKKIFTGQSGKTLCMPEVATVSLSSVDGVDRRIAVFDEVGCLKKGPTYSDLKSCENADALAIDTTFNAVSGCNDGISVGLTPSIKNLEITSIEVDDPESDNENDKIIRWVSKEKKHALIQHSTGSASDGGAAVHGSWLIRPLNSIVKQSTGFVTLSGNIFTIKKQGIYKVDFFGAFFATDDSQVRLENTVDGTEIYYGSSAYARFITGATDAQNSISIGSAIIEVETEKSFKMSYRADKSYILSGLGHANPWGPNVYASVCITSL